MLGRMMKGEPTGCSGPVGLLMQLDEEQGTSSLSFFFPHQAGGFSCPPGRSTLRTRPFSSTVSPAFPLSQTTVKCYPYPGENSSKIHAETTKKIQQEPRQREEEANRISPSTRAQDRNTGHTETRRCQGRRSHRNLFNHRSSCPFRR